MIGDGAALHRISSTKQEDGHSIPAQESSTHKKAQSMGVKIVKYWSVTTSSKKGKNAKRSDLRQIVTFCKKNKNVKFLFIDRVDRLMREMKQMVAYILELEELGVKIIFCDPSQEYLNSNDQISQLLLIIEGFRAESDNKNRTDTTNSRMLARYKEGYYLSHPHPGYKKSFTPGLHEPDEPRFSILQKGCYLVIYEGYSGSQAVRWINDHGYKTNGGRRLDLNHFVEFIENPYYYGILTVQRQGPLDSIKGVRGLHIPMLSKREHELLIGILKKRNPRIRKSSNPEFPLSNILRHFECVGKGGYEKVTGYYHDKGKTPYGIKRPRVPVYSCRDCRKRFSRDKVHKAISKHLDSMQFVPSSDQFRKALVQVWKKQRGSVQQRINVLENNKLELEHKIQKTVVDYSNEPEGAVKKSFALLLVEYDQQLELILHNIKSTQAVELESEAFVSFGFDFIEKLRSKWWDLSKDNLMRGEQILFNGNISYDNSAFVHTPNLSTIYRLNSNKKDPFGVNFSNMVELVGTAPTSAGLSWLVVYRHSSF